MSIIIAFYNIDRTYIIYTILSFDLTRSNQQYTRILFLTEEGRLFLAGEGVSFAHLNTIFLFVKWNNHFKHFFYYFSPVLRGQFEYSAI